MKKNLTGLVILFAFTFIVVFSVFKPFLQNPNSFMVNKTGDAIKSYYNFAYMLRYDSGMRNDGINYPYGEHIQMSNSHPFHQFFFRQVNKIFPVEKYGVAIINLSMILSLFAFLPFIFLILRRNKLPVWYSVAISLIILFLSPQIGRIKGHFEMAYLFFIPMWWYFLLKFRDRKHQWLWGVLLVATALIAGFTSAYLIAFYAIFIWGLIIADCWIYRKNLKPYYKQGLILLIMAIIPLIAVKVTLNLTDWVTDRPTRPYGFFIFHSNIFSVFLPFEYWISALSPSLFKKFNIVWEGHSNIGFPATVVAAVLVCLILYRSYTRKKISELFPDKEFNPYLIAAFLILLFSMCIPFKWGLGILLNILPPLRQFRALGRFAWIFYYVFTVYTAKYIYIYFKKLRSEGKQLNAFIIMLLTLSTWSYDAYINSSKYLRNIVYNNDRLESNNKNYLKRFDIMGVKPDDFQSIFFIPFANTSGDKMFFERGMGAFAEGMRCSYATRLPLIESFSPRISFSQALSSIQLLSDSCIRKTRLDDMNNKPILLLSMNSGLNKNEKWLKDHSDSLWADKWITLSAFSPETLKKSYQNWIVWADSTKLKLKGTNNMKADVNLNKIFYLNFDNDQSDHIFTGKGAIYKRRHKIEIFNQDFGTEMTGEYDLSFWIYFDTRKYDMPSAILNKLDKFNSPLSSIRLNVRGQNNVYKNWVRVDQKITLKPGAKYQLVLNGSYITIDDLLLKPEGSNVYIRTSDGKELMNNFVIDK